MYKFEDFTICDSKQTNLQDLSIWLSIFDDSVPCIFKDKALQKLNEFILENIENTPFDKTDKIVAILDACIGEELDKKYKLLIFIWNENEVYKKDYLLEVPILPNDAIFSEFKKCIINELESMIF